VCVWCVCVVSPSIVSKAARSLLQLGLLSSFTLRANTRGIAGMLRAPSLQTMYGMVWCCMVKKFRNDKKRCVTLQRAHNNMFTHVTRAWRSDACPPVATFVCLTAPLMSMQPAPPNPPSTFPTHVDWLMFASMSGSLVPTHTNDAPRHPTARMQHQTSPPALLDGTGLLQMPLQRATSPAAKQDNCTNWKHMRTTRNQQRHHEPSETPRLNATHTHQRGSDNTPLAKPHPLLPTRRAHPFTTAAQRRQECAWETQGTILGYRGFEPSVPKECALGFLGYRRFKPSPLSSPVERHSQPPSTGRKTRGRGGREKGSPPGRSRSGGGCSKGLTFSLHITQSHAHIMLCLYASPCACVPWLLGWF